MSDTVLTTDLRIAELEQGVRELRAKLAAQRADLERADFDRRDFPRTLREIVDMTNSILPGDVRIESKPDPEYPATNHIVFRVTPTVKLEDVNAVIDKEIEWHRNARRILPEATCHLSLAIEQNEGR